MNGIEKYRKGLFETLNRAFDTQTEVLETAAHMLCDTIVSGHNVFAFGCSHAGLLADELYYRTGGLAVINPIHAPGLHCDYEPVASTSQFERLPGYGRVIIDSQPLGEGDLIIIHSVSGRNHVTVDAAMRAREKGARVIALTNMEMSRGVTSRHPSGKRLFECADLVIDNCGCPGDASVVIEGVPEKVAPTSTAVGASLLNAVVARTVELIAQTGRTVPVYMSANLDAGDAHNKKMMDEYKDHIFYMGH